MCWSLPTIFAIILKMTKQAFAGVTTSEKTRRARKGETMSMTAWLTCWRVIETFSNNLGNWILCHSESVDNKRHAHPRTNRKRAGWRPRGTPIAMTVLAMQANATIATERKTQFDKDSETIGIDNRCSGCLPHVRDNFVGELRQTDRVVKGFAGTKTTNVQVGTLRWSWEDAFRTPTTFPTDEFAF